jgi:hypothetical protein
MCPRIRITCLLLAIAALGWSSTSALAEGGDDWVLVKRFQEQLGKAKQGDTQAMYEVGRMYERGRGTESDINQALAWYEKAAKNGQNSDASARIGILYLEGQGVPQDYAKAFKHLSEAANAGAPAAQYYLALMYEEGHGLNSNPAAALNWYKKAAKGGYYQAEQGITRLESQAKRPTLDQPPDSTSKPSVTKPKPKPDLTRRLLEVVLNGHWQRNGKPSGFLPSSASTCTEEPNKHIKCLSAEQTRNTGFATITFVTVADISDFTSSDEFIVNYYNNVLNVKQENEASSNGPADDGFGSTSGATSRVKLGKQSTEHHLDCSLKDKNTIVCVKNLTTTQTFENKK